MRFETIETLQTRRELLQTAKGQVKRRVVVCAGTGCVAGGAIEIYEELLKAGKDSGLDFQVDLEPCGGEHETGPDHVTLSGCHGFCQMGPLLHVLPEDILYTGVKVADVAEIVEKTFKGGEVIDRLLFVEPNTEKHQKGRDDLAFYNTQTRIALAGCGDVDPESIDDYIANGGYEALRKALFEMKPDEIIGEIEKSKLRGRGGGGFVTGKKWRSAAKAAAALANGAGRQVYVICNGDEGDPGAFMDRSIMEGDPFKVLEGMTIGAFALGSTEGYIYVRHEYPLAVERLEKAIATSRKAGMLGDDILGSGFSFDVKINRGGGAFVCGESSALMRSVEGQMGEPRPKYVHSTEKGLYEKPTVLNNVETWVTVAEIVGKGADWFLGIGTEGSPGTKAFSLVGKVNNTGLDEVPMGATMREIIFDIGGGIIGGKKFKAVQTGGPSGGCLPESHLDTPVDFDTLTKAGSMMGSGGMIVLDERNCMVSLARYFVQFLIQESCGKCVPCREGLQQLHHMLSNICDGKAREDELDRIHRLCKVLEKGSLCALGQTAVNPVLTTIRFFEDEYKEHINGKKCRAGECKELIAYSINDKCTGCMLCVKPCPVSAISGEKKKQHTLNAELCTKCGVCESVCKDGAITVE